MRVEDMSVTELETERVRLEQERTTLAKNWMVDDPDNEWNEIEREINRIDELLNVRRQQ